jgi:hypothetical protein
MLDSMEYRKMHDSFIDYFVVAIVYKIGYLRVGLVSKQQKSFRIPL